MAFAVTVPSDHEVAKIPAVVPPSSVAVTSESPDADPASPPPDDAVRTTPSSSLSNAALVRRYYADIEAFWRRELPAVFGIDLRPVLPPEAFNPLISTTLPICNGSRVIRSTAIDNAFYCLQENVIAYDARGLLPDLRSSYGDLAVGVLFAHEYGHAIQNQADQYGESLGIELQADCYSGAWAHTQVANEMSTSDGDVRGVLRSYAEFSDLVGTSRRVAHGSASDRSAAFLQGFHAGVVGCVGLNSSPTSEQHR